MLFQTRFAALCLVLLGTGMTWAQDNIRVFINFRGDVTITGTRNADDLKMVAFGVLGLISENGTPIEVRYPGGVLYDTALFLPGSSTDSIIRFNLGDGNDRFELAANVKNVTAYLGRGNDSFFSNNSTEVERDLIIDAGVGRDSIYLNNVAVFRNMRLSLGANDGQLSESTVIEGCDVFGTCTLNQTSGGSYHGLTNLYVNKALRATFGIGNDVFYGNINTENTYVNLGPGVDGGEQVALLANSDINGSLTVIGGGDQDRLSFNDSLATGNAIMNSGAGDDEVELISSNVAGNVSLNTSSGNDTVAITNVGSRIRSGNFSVNTGPGDDVLEMGFWDTRTFRALLGSGDDRVFPSGSFFTGVSTEIGVPYLNGGAGTDWFNAFDNPDSLNLISFQEGPPAT